jgi:hypothetical protein
MKTIEKIHGFVDDIVTKEQGKLVAAYTDFLKKTNNELKTLRETLNIENLRFLNQEHVKSMERSLQWMKEESTGG